MSFHLHGLPLGGIALGLLLACGAAAAQSTSTSALTAAAVASPDRYGALAAQSVLREGGNAVDAAVATAFTLAVSYPEAGNIGGGGFMTLFVNGQAYFLDYRETAPAAASANMYLDNEGRPTQNSLYGNLAVGIPGTVRGLAEAHQRFGKLTWQQDLAPAIALARAGFIVPEALIKERDEALSDFARSGNFAAWARNLHTGQLFRQPVLAETLERIAKGGAEGFYSGGVSISGTTFVLPLARAQCPPVNLSARPTGACPLQLGWRASLRHGRAVHLS